MSKFLTRYKVVFSLLIIFMGLNIWLLYNKVNLQKKLTVEQSYNIRKEADVSSLAQPVKFFPLHLKSKTANKPLKLIAIFTDQGCIHCAKAEISYLNEWDKRFKNTLQVYLVHSSNQYLTNLGAHFSIQKIKSANHLFSISLQVVNPLIVLMDQKNNIQAIHTTDPSRPGSDQRRNAFYKRMHSLFQSVYGTQ